MEYCVTFLVQGRASARIIKLDGEPGYFDSLYVNPRYRRRGYGFELMKFALQHSQEFLEMDILRRAKACQRNAAKIGYQRTGEASQRYVGCDLWRYCGVRRPLPVSSFCLLSSVTYEGKKGKTEVLYLGDLEAKKGRPH
jgi:GNAT superfamily N-acetyltransferase